MSIPFINPKTCNQLVVEDGALVDSVSNKKIADIENGVPRFVKKVDNYAENFAWQWKKWGNSSKDDAGVRKYLLDEILYRTNFDKFDMEGKSILECGSGAGDDTVVLATLPFSEIHSFDISTAIDVVDQQISDKRLTLSQASILEIPYPDESFDVVYCHRVLQHTPDPVNSLISICAKVKPGGILFAHSYKRSVRSMIQWKYKYRWITKRLPLRWVYNYVQSSGKYLHKVNRLLYKNIFTMLFAYNFIPFYYADRPELNEDEIIEFEKLCTFDALIPAYDIPMTAKQFFGTIEKQGFRIVNKHDPKASPLWCTAIKNK